jgi:stearoyl-CoA desaturase (delta-9 desaturase)
MGDQAFKQIIKYLLEAPMSLEAQHADEDPYAVHHLIIPPGADAERARVRWDPVHSLWQATMLAATLILAPLTMSWDAVLVFVLLTGVTLLVGHSVGFHRRLIHGSFQAPLWVDHLMMWVGTLVGICGPLAMMRAHDERDWGQRQARCHPFLSNRAGFFRDYWWNLHCRLEFARPPVFAPAPRIARDRFYRFLERTWLLQQVPVAIALYLCGGAPWVVWGVAARVCVSATGHWLVGRFAHRHGPQSWLVDGSGVQAHDVPWVAIPTMGEAWHNNHHAYPGSAKLGLYPGQADWGFVLIRVMERLGLAWDIRTPDTLPPRPALRAVIRKRRRCRLTGQPSLT